MGFHDELMTSKGGVKQPGSVALLYSAADEHRHPTMQQVCDSLSAFPGWPCFWVLRFPPILLLSASPAPQGRRLC